MIPLLLSFALAVSGQAAQASGGPSELTQQLLGGSASTREDEPERPSATPFDATLRELSGRMRDVGARIQEGLLGGEVRQEQQAIIAELETLLRSAEQQRGSESMATESSKEGAGRDDQGRGRPENSTPSSSDRGDATTGLAGSGKGEEGAEQRAPFRGRGLMEVWGQLPVQLQQQVLSPLHEDFLPSYKRQIIDYYERLSEPRQR